MKDNKTCHIIITAILTFFSLSLFVTDTVHGQTNNESLVANLAYEKPVTQLTTTGLAEVQTSVVTDFPTDLQLYPRDVSSNIATAVVSGVIGSEYTDVTLKLYQDDSLIFTWYQDAADSDEFLFLVDLEAMLVNYEFELIGIDENNNETIIASASDVVAGDVFVINGQSNAVSGIYSSAGPGYDDASDFIRTYGSLMQTDEWIEDDSWAVTRTECRPSSQHSACIGRLAQRLAYNLVTTEGIPVAVINGARGGQSIDYFQRNDADPFDDTGNYGRLYTALTTLGIEDDIRGWFWYQGENDRLDAQGHEDGFTVLFADWETDYSSVEQFYIFQIRHTCFTNDLVTGQGAEISNFQREFANARENVTPMSTTGIDEHNGCHYQYDGYKRLADNITRTVRRDLYDQPLLDADAPDIVTAELVDLITVELTFTPNNTLIADDGFEALFELSDNESDVIYDIVDGVVLDDTTVQLILADPLQSDVNLSYYSLSGDQNWLTNQEGIGIQSFLLFPVTDPLLPTAVSFQGASIVTQNSATLVKSLFVMVLLLTVVFYLAYRVRKN